jgi:hypothetical protein
LAVPRPSGKESTIGWLFAICARCHVIFILYRYLAANVYKTEPDTYLPGATRNIRTQTTQPVTLSPFSLIRTASRSR